MNQSREIPGIFGPDGETFSNAGGLMTITPATTHKQTQK
jgi:hypothetical protein